MLAALAIWLLVLAAGWGYGKLVVASEFEVCRTYSGILLIAGLLLALALFHSLQWWLGALVLLPGLVLAFRDRAVVKFRVIAVSTVLMVPLALWITSREVSFYDTALYHQQAVKWLSEYGLVRGIALIGFRFALVSSWFAAAAPMNHGPLAGRVADIIGGIPIALMLVPSLLLCWQFRRARAIGFRAAIWILFCFALAIVAISRSVENSLSPDMMAWLLPGDVLMILTDSARPESDRIGHALLISALACLVKVSSAPALVWCGLLAVYYLFRKRTGRAKILGYLAASVAVILFLSYTNVVASGCPAFPLSLGCISADWSVGKNFETQLMSGILGFNRSGRYDAQIGALTALALISSVLLYSRFSDLLVRHGLAISWLGIAFVFAASPVPRYGMGYFLLPAAMAAALALGRLGIRAPAIMAAVVVTGSLAFLLRPDMTAHLLLPVRMAGSEGDPIYVHNQTSRFRTSLRLRQESHGELKVWIPVSSNQCWNAPLPCSEGVSADRIALRNPAAGFRGGFVKMARIK